MSIGGTVGITSGCRVEAGPGSSVVVDIGI